MAHALTRAISDLVILDDAFLEADQQVAVLLHEALAEMKSVLPALRHGRMPQPLNSWREIFRIIQAFEVWRQFGRFVREYCPSCGPGVAERMQAASTVTAAQAGAARKMRAEARDLIVAMARPGTILVLPAAPCIAPRLNTPTQDLESFRIRTMRLTCIAGLAGLPQISIPVGTISGCPVGLSFIGWRGGDEVLLDLSFALSRFVGIV